MTQLYWQVYLNLEREFLALAETIYINDIQQEVYSMRIADLLIRTVIEIEALAKELYLCNGGEEKPDNEMFFDTVCMAHINELWKLDKKIVLVTSPNIYFEKVENKILRPLHKANKRGDSSADWNKAYQAVKHNRIRYLQKGNLKNLLHGLAALYVLNLYYKDEMISHLSSKDKSSINPSFGSSLFSVKIHQEHGFKENVNFIKGQDFDECVYIIDYEPITQKKAMDALKIMDDYINNGTQAELERLADERIKRGEEITEEWALDTRIKLMTKILPIKDHKLSKMYYDAITGVLFNVVLNKQQY